MPVVITAVLPPHVTLDMVRDIEAQLDDVDAAGLIVHAVTYDSQINSVRIVDIWESERARDEFAQQHLGPAVRRAAASAGDSSPAPVSGEVAETVLLRIGRRSLGDQR